MHTRYAAPMAWARAQNNLGLALRWLGTLRRNAAQFDAAGVAFTQCLTVWTRIATPLDWAKRQWNLAGLALARHALEAGPALLSQAQEHLSLAREVFAWDANAHQLAECDRLPAQIGQRSAA